MLTSLSPFFTLPTSLSPFSLPSSHPPSPTFSLPSSLPTSLSLCPFVLPVLHIFRIDSASPTCIRSQPQVSGAGVHYRAARTCVQRRYREDLWRRKPQWCRWREGPGSPARPGCDPSTGIAACCLAFMRERPPRRFMAIASPLSQSFHSGCLRCA